MLTWKLKCWPKIQTFELKKPKCWPENLNFDLKSRLLSLRNRNVDLKTEILTWKPQFWQILTWKPKCWLWKRKMLTKSRLFSTSKEQIGLIIIFAAMKVSLMVTMDCNSFNRLLMEADSISLSKWGTIKHVRTALNSLDGNKNLVKNAYQRIAIVAVGR